MVNVVITGKFLQDEDLSFFARTAKQSYAEVTRGISSPTFGNRVLKPLRHVAMGAEFSVLNKPTLLSKWRRFQSHR